VAVEAGARTVNLPDTVGYMLPDEYAAMFRYVRAHGDFPADVVFSAHCHDDLGLATANTMSAIQAGVRQVEVTVNGLGERAGNAPIEEVVMALKTRGESLGLPSTGVDARQLVPSSLLMARLTGLAVQANKAVVGVNAFAHEAGIHQDGFIKERSTYEIMRPEDVGWSSSRLVLGKHSGRHGVAFRLKQLGYNLDATSLDGVYRRFIELADRQKEVDDGDLHRLVGGLDDQANRFAPSSMHSSAQPVVMESVS
jgi:2-isopropylmalate synthase